MFRMGADGDPEGAYHQGMAVVATIRDAAFDFKRIANKKREKTA